MLENLLDPRFVFFVDGFNGSVLRSEPLSVHAFKPSRAFFILEMGLAVAQRLPEIKKAACFW